MSPYQKVFTFFVFVIFTGFICIYVFNQCNHKMVPFIFISHTETKSMETTNMTKTEVNYTEEANTGTENTDNKSNVQSKFIDRTEPKTKYLEKSFFNIKREVVKSVNCGTVIQGDKTELERGHNVMKRTKIKAVTSQTYSLMTKNCVKFKLDRGYVTHHLTNTERNFPLAYSLLVFKDVEQAERLLRAVYRPQNIYCIHVDKKSKVDVREAITSLTRCFDNVFMASRSVDVRWGYFSVLEPELICMEDLLKKNKKWKYFINLTGQEFPLKTNLELVKILTVYDGANDLEGTVKRANKDRWQKAGRPPHNITAVKGSVHVVVNRDFVEFASHKKVARDLLQWVKNTSVPDETFFATLNHNPQLGIRGSYKGIPETDGTIKPFLARYKQWWGAPCSGYFVRGICIFGIGDLPSLTSVPHLFANKFYWDYQYLTLQCLEEWHFNRTRDEYLGKVNFTTRFYENLGFVKNKVA